MESISLKAYAKINLFLEVCDKRSDNYHNIDSIMQTVSLFDLISIHKSDVITLSNNVGLPNDKTNLAYKAATSFFDYTDIKCGAQIDIIKSIPMSAGLAGGSADAAAVLRGLNDLYSTHLSVDTLCKIGAKIGADVPFCIVGGTCLTKGIGDVLRKCSPMPECYILVSKMGEGVSTPYAYSEIDNSRAVSKYATKNSDNMIAELEKQNLFGIIDNFYNAFEAVVEPIRPMIYEQKRVMNESGALSAMMSGSGPSVFGIFLNKSDAMSALDKLRSIGADAHLCDPINVI